MSDAVFLPVSWLFGLIGFNTTNVVGGALHQCLDQGVSLFLREGTQRIMGTTVTHWIQKIKTYKFLCAIKNKTQTVPEKFQGLRKNLSLSDLDLVASGARTPPFLCLQVLREQSLDELTGHKHSTTVRSPWGHRSCVMSRHGYLQLTALHQLDDVAEQHVSVPLAEPADIVRHLRRSDKLRVVLQVYCKCRRAVLMS